jgi:hypothetical protein
MPTFRVHVTVTPTCPRCSGPLEPGAPGVTPGWTFCIRCVDFIPPQARSAPAYPATRQECSPSERQIENLLGSDTKMLSSEVLDSQSG